MRRSCPILLSVALLFACGYAAAATSQHMGADGNTGCPDNTAASNDRNDLGDIDPAAATVAPVRHGEKTRTNAAPRANVGARTTAPRWHSFLPGMIR